jgi:foldase protein PrsA
MAAIGLSQVDLDKVVLVVNGEEIKGAEYYRRMEFLPGTGQMLGDRFAEFPPGFMTIEQLITERLVYQLAKKKHCMPTDDEVQAELNRAKDDNPQIAENWVASGRAIEDLLNNYRLELAEFRLETNGITVTDQEIDDHYKQYPSEFTTPKTFKLRLIAVDTDDQKATVDKALAAGTAFADVAAQYSVDLSNAARGLLGDVPETNLPDAVKAGLLDVAVGKTSDWIPVSGKDNATRYCKFLKENVNPSKLLPMDAKLREITRRRLMLDQANSKKTNTIAEDMAEMRKAAQIDIKRKDFADVYNKFIDMFLKQQAAKLGTGK